MVVVAGKFTVCVMGEELLPASDGLPPYWAVIVCEPTASVESVNCTKLCPLGKLVDPSEVVPSKRVTSPVASPLLIGKALTVTVKVTGELAIEGFPLDETVVLVGPGFTTSFSAAEVLPEKFESPLYVALSDCVLTGNPEKTVNCALPLMTMALPRVDVPE